MEGVKSALDRIEFFHNRERVEILFAESKVELLWRLYTEQDLFDGSDCYCKDDYGDIACSYNGKDCERIDSICWRRPFSDCVKNLVEEGEI